MAARALKCQDKGMGNKDREREERLAAALRENLRRRKAQAREVEGGAPAKAGAQSIPAKAGIKER